MADLKEAIRELTGREPSVDDMKRLNDIARHFGWKQNDPLVDIVAVLDAETRLLAEVFQQMPGEVEATIARIREAGQKEVADCELKMSAASALLQANVLREVVPQIGKEVAEIAASKIGQYKLALSGAIAFLFLAIGLLIGFLQGGKLINLPTVQVAAANVAANALFDAIRDNSNPWLLKKLISGGINVNIVNEYGNSPLLFAVKQEAKLDVITALIEAGADVNAMDKDGVTPLLRSLMGRDMKQEPGVVSALISARADVNVQHGTEGATPLMFAVVNNNPDPEVVSALVKAGADIRVKNRISGKTAFDYANENPALKDNPAVLKLLGKK